MSINFGAFPNPSVDPFNHEGVNKSEEKKEPVIPQNIDSENLISKRTTVSRGEISQSIEDTLKAIQENKEGKGAEGTTAKMFNNINSQIQDSNLSEDRQNSLIDLVLEAKMDYALRGKPEMAIARLKSALHGINKPSLNELIVTFFSKETLESNLNVIKSNLTLPAIRKNIETINEQAESFFSQIDKSTSIEFDKAIFTPIFSNLAPFALANRIINDLKIAKPLGPADKLKNFGTQILAGLAGRIYFSVTAPLLLLKQTALMPLKVLRTLADTSEDPQWGKLTLVKTIDTDKAIFGRVIMTSGLVKTAFTVAKAITLPLQSIAKTALLLTFGFESMLMRSQNESTRYTRTIDKIIQIINVSYIVTKY